MLDCLSGLGDKMTKFKRWGPFVASLIQIVIYIWWGFTPHGKCPLLPEPLESVGMPIAAFGYGSLVMWGILNPFINKNG
jgi:hypothetical protein